MTIDDDRRRGTPSDGLNTPQNEPLRRAARPRLAASAAATLAHSAIVVGWALRARPCSARGSSVRAGAQLAAGRHDQQVLYSQFREQLSRADAPLGGAIAAGAPVALMTMPGVGMHRRGDRRGHRVRRSKSGPGHKRDTALPVRPGSSVVSAGPRCSAAVRRLAHAQAGRPITVPTGQGEANYRSTTSGTPAIRTRRRWPPAGRLTLVTAGGDGLATGWAPEGCGLRRRQVAGQGFPGPTGGLPCPEGREHDAGRTGALFLLVLWLPLLARRQRLVWV